MDIKQVCVATALLLLSSCGRDGKQTFQTEYFKIEVDKSGYIVGMWNETKASRNFSPAD